MKQRRETHWNLCGEGYFHLISIIFITTEWLTEITIDNKRIYCISLLRRVSTTFTLFFWFCSDP